MLTCSPRASRLVVTLAVVFVAAAHGTAPPIRAQEAPPDRPAPAPAESELRIEDVEARIKQVQDAKDIDEDTRARLLALYQPALDHLKRAATFRAALQQTEAAVSGAAASLEKLKTELAEPVGEPVVQAPPDANVAQLTSLLAEREAALKSAQQELDAVLEDQRRRTTRRLEAPKELAAAREALEQVRTELGTAVAAPSDPLQAAKRTLLTASRIRYEAEVRALESEIPSYDARNELLAARRDAAARKVSTQEKLAAAWRTYMTEQRRLEAERQASQAAQATSAETPLIRQAAERNRGLADERTQLVGKIESLDKTLGTTRAALEKVRRDFEDVRNKAEAAGLSQIIGYLLRDHRKKLSTTVRVTSRSEEISRVQVRKFDIESESLALTDVVSRVEEIAKDAVAEKQVATEEDLARFKQQLQQLLEERQSLVKSLEIDYESYFGKLIQAESTEGELRRLTRDFASFIDERVLWIRSAGAFSTAEIVDNWTASRDAIRPARLVDFGRRIVRTLEEEAVTFAFWSLALALLFLAGPALRRRLRAVGDQASKVRTDSFVLTMQALVYTVALAAFWPGVLAVCGWIVEETSGTDDTDAPLATGFFATSAVLLLLQLLRKACRPRGLGETHFRWSGRVVRLLRVVTGWTTIIALPVIFISVTLGELSMELGKETLGRAPFLVTMLMAAVVFALLLSPKRGLLRDFLADHPHGWLSRLRWLWYPAAVGTPLTLGIIAAIGYYYTGRVLARELVLTAWLCVGLHIVLAMSLRWLLISKRRIVIDQALARRAAIIAAREAEQEEPGAERVDDSSPTAEIQFSHETEIDVDKIDVQSNNILRTLITLGFAIGAWFIWVDVLPALDLLNDVTLGWTKYTDPSGKDVPATLGDLTFAGIVAFLTLVSARNISGFLQISALRNVPLDAGSRYAIGTVASYVITLVGVIVSLNAIGFGWSNLQWLVAALTVGLGFGLQEIFANFVSGLILLFERPIRVGDTVTVSGVDGTVTDIRTRATVITDWNHKELLVPNKEFITGQVVNWTLTNPVTRLVIPVGIAYGSDTELARHLLLKVASETKVILADPPARALFRGFGESSLDFELRAFVRGIDDLQLARHALCMGIDQEFRKAGIEIAFPQRDLHLRTVPRGLRRATEAEHAADA